MYVAARPSHRRRQPTAVPLGDLDVVPPLRLLHDRRPTRRARIVAPPVKRGGNGIVRLVAVAIPCPTTAQRHPRRVAQRRHIAPLERA